MAHFPFIIWNWQVMSKKKEWKIGQTFVAFSEHLTCSFWLSCAVRMWIKLSSFSKLFWTIWSYGNTGYKVSNSGIQNSSLPPFTRWNRFSVIVFTLLIDFKPLTVHSSSATPNFSTCNAAADTKVNAQISLHNTHQLELFW